VDQERITPATTAFLWRILGIALLAVLWFRGGSGPESLILVLFLAILAIARWRFPRFPAWTVLLDQAACGAAMLLWPNAAYGLALPVLDAVFAGEPWLSLPVLVIVTATGSWSLPFAAALLCAVIAGASVRLWARQLESARRDADRDRRDRYDLESLKAELLAANVRSARMAELAERARIARDLHDHTGHELTAAHLALQAYAKLHDTGDPQAGEMLEEAQRRVGTGMDLLRTTVHGLAPRHPAGIGAFEEICLRFTVCRVALAVHGNTDRIPAHIWSVLEPCLKEGLANAARHAGAESIDVSLDVGPRIVRLSVRNACRGPASEGGGLGLRNLRQRASAVGGSVSVDASDGFRLVCVLPLDDEAQAVAAAPSSAAAGPGAPPAAPVTPAAPPPTPPPSSEARP
jgi:two-component system, NarL family, sensor histidine kinase DesK